MKTMKNKLFPNGSNEDLANHKKYLSKKSL